MTQYNSRNRNICLLDLESTAEMARLLNMDRFLTRAMGGPLASLPSVPEQARILDLACGPGGWTLDTASRYPTSEVVGVDISHRMIDYAKVSAQVHKVSNISFELADVTRTLPIASGTFDIVHARALAAVLPRQAWKPFVTECTRVLRESGVLLLTEAIDEGVTNSPAFERMQALTSLMMWRAGYGFSIDGQKLDVSFMLPPLLRSAGYSDIQHAAYALEFSRGTSAWADFYHNAEIGYMLRLSNYVKFADLSAEEIEHAYYRMLAEMKQNDFSGMFHFMTVVGRKP